MSCQRDFHEIVCEQTIVRITPKVTALDVETTCIGDLEFGQCPGNKVAFCDVTVHQEVCVEVNLAFNANAELVATALVCGTPETGACPEIIVGCTHTIGFFRNHPDVTAALIAAAGGSIVLGIDSAGLSFTATAANATAILSFNVPSPPAPSSPPFAQQYQVLYAQLLAANLNVIAGATCPFATAAIAAANLFLATSPPGGMAGAPAVQAPLAQFNEGNGPGCPGHCPDNNGG